MLHTPPTALARSILSTATVTVDQFLSASGTERVSGMPATLAVVPGSTPTVAAYVLLFSPVVNVDIINLPLIGYVTEIVVANTTITRPSSCGFLFGSATLDTSITIADGTNPTVVVSGSDTWNCIGFQMLNL